MPQRHFVKIGDYMTVTVKEMLVPSSDGIHNLSGKVFVPSGKIKGLFHIVHGMTEHIDRYFPLMQKISENGYVCFGFDNLGHGKTAKDDSELGFIAEKDGYKYLIEDIKCFSDEIKKEFTNLDYFLFGHSMGSFIVRLFAQKYGNSIKKLIVCGTAGPIAIAPIGLFITKLLSFLKGKKKYSQFCENLAFGAYNNQTEKITEYDWLTNDREIIDAYSKDKFCTFRFTLSALCDLIALNINCNKKAWFKLVDKDLPILLIAGDKDPVGDYGKGVQKVFDNLIKYGKDAEIKLYEGCRHEIHNDFCKDEMFEDIIFFIG